MPVIFLIIASSSGRAVSSRSRTNLDAGRPESSVLEAVEESSYQKEKQSSCYFHPARHNESRE